MSDDKFSGNLIKVFSVILLQNDGSRIYSKYFNKIFSSRVNNSIDGNLQTQEARKQFEKNICEKSKKLIGSRSLKQTDTEIFSYGNFNIIFKQLGDCFLFVVGDFDENEMLLELVLQCIYDCLVHYTKTISKKTILENYEYLVIMIDEIIDEGLMVTLDHKIVIARTSMIDCEHKDQVQQQDNSMFASVFNMAKNQFSKNMR